MNKEIIQSLTQNWQKALETKDTETVIQLYDKEAILIPTLSNIVCDTQDKRRNYFNNFLQKEPKCEITESHINVSSNYATHSGTYKFNLKNNLVSNY